MLTYQIQRLIQSTKGLIQMLYELVISGSTVAISTVILYEKQGLVLR